MLKSLFTLIFILLSGSLYAAQPESISIGTHSKGSIENAWQLPPSGKNFEAYSRLGVVLGRNYIHSKVYRAVLQSYSTLEITMPGRKFIYGETGWRKGGNFRPHKTHQNGLSVDFFVPVVTKSGESVFLPTSPLNKFGYNIEFNSDGNYKEYTIDYEAIAAHLLALKAAADRQGIKIWRVIFDNELQKGLFKTLAGKRLKNEIKFSTKKPWVRHDEHYHVDFLLE